jgi:hypothetical protein
MQFFIGLICGSACRNATRGIIFLSRSSAVSSSIYLASYFGIARDVSRLLKLLAQGPKVSGFLADGKAKSG